MKLKKRLFRILAKTAIILVIVLLLFIGTALLYHIFTRHTPAAWLPAASEYLVYSPDFASFRESAAFLGHQSSLSNRAEPFLHKLETIINARPEFFRRIPVFFSSPLYFAVSGDERVLILDMGAHSLLFSGSLFAVRSVFPPDTRIRFSFQETHLDGEDFNLYTISRFPESTHIHFFIEGNLLILSDNRQSLLRTVRSHAQDETLIHTPSWPRLQKHHDSGVPALLLPSPGRSGLFDGIPRVFDAAIYKLYPGPPLVKTIGAAFLVSREELREQRTLARIFESNTFLPELQTKIPSQAASFFVACFDDLQEFNRGWKSVFPGAAKKESRSLQSRFSNTLHPGLYNWTANAVALFFWEKQPWLLVQSRSKQAAYQGLSPFLQTDPNFHSLQLAPEAPFSAFAESLDSRLGTNSLLFIGNTVLLGEKALLPVYRDWLGTNEAPEKGRNAAGQSVDRAYEDLFSQPAHLYIHRSTKNRLPAPLDSWLQQICFLFPDMKSFRVRLRNQTVWLDMYHR